LLVARVDMSMGRDRPGIWKVCMWNDEMMI
jgi:hypothetical protein